MKQISTAPRLCGEAPRSLQHRWEMAQMFKRNQQCPASSSTGRSGSTHSSHTIRLVYFTSRKAEFLMVGIAKSKRYRKIMELDSKV